MDVTIIQLATYIRGVNTNHIKLRQYVYTNKNVYGASLPQGLYLSL
jgi:hypothetical protein